MKIFIEATPIFKDRSGVGQYAKRLTEAMVALAPNDKFTLFGFRLWPKPLPTHEIVGTNVSYRFIRFFPGRVYNMLFRLSIKLPIDLLLRQRPDVIFFPNFTLRPTLSRHTKKVVVIHDLSFIYFPQFASPLNRRDNQKLVPYSIAKADHIITISKNSKDQIIKNYKVASAKVTIVSPAVDRNFFKKRSEAEIKKVRTKYKLPNKYIFYTSTLEPRKNVEGVLEAYSALDSKTKAEYGLVLAGGKGWQDEAIHAAIDKHRSNDEVIVTTGYVPDEDLPAMYSGASLFLFPSFYEGFGIPILEAFACGVPVITANNSSLPEVAGHAAILIKAEDSPAITKAIKKVLSDSKLANNLRQKGLVQIQNFDWEDSAKKTSASF